MTVFRVVQEALTNVRKHTSSATRVTVALFYEDWGVDLLVEDDGPGFHVPGSGPMAESGHLGLIGMTERAQLFGGTLEVESQPGQGTTVRLRLPRSVEVW